MSKELIIEFSISFTSPEMRAKISPLRSSEKKVNGKVNILSLILFLISLTTPVRIGIRKYKAKYIAEVLNTVEIIKYIANKKSVADAPFILIISRTYQLKLFCNASPKAFHEEIEKTSREQGTYSYTFESTLNNIFNIGIIKANENKFKIAARILDMILNARYFL